ncbi:hypothetical protein [Nocardioides ochotonae]|uniref:hypothetical protein n=1 Tax=Nocardioides ochotonae TaxID=2685869 RepID=UPI00140ABD3C|nr:hypothetical protein [Nocardioides ochotonae]
MSDLIYVAYTDADGAQHIEGVSPPLAAVLLEAGLGRLATWRDSGDPVITDHD